MKFNRTTNLLPISMYLLHRLHQPMATIFDQRYKLAQLTNAQLKQQVPQSYTSMQSYEGVYNFQVQLNNSVFNNVKILENAPTFLNSIVTSQDLNLSSSFILNSNCPTTPTPQNDKTSGFISPNNGHDSAPPSTISIQPPKINNLKLKITTLPAKNLVFKLQKRSDTIQTTNTNNQPPIALQTAVFQQLYEQQTTTSNQIFKHSLVARRLQALYNMHASSSQHPLHHVI